MASLKFLNARRRWRLRWHITLSNGLIQKGSQNFKFKDNALEAKKAIDRLEDRYKSGLAEPPENLVSARDKWLICNKKFTARTQEHYHCCINRFVDAVSISAVDVRILNASHIQDYLNNMLNHGIINRTINAHLTVIKSFCKWVSQTYNIQNVARDIQMFHEDPPEQRFLTPDEYKILIDSIKDPFLLDIIRFLAHTGLRATEFSELTWNNINQDSTQMTVTGKGRKRRVVPLNHTCREILDRQGPRNPKNNIFISKSNRRIMRHRLYEICRDAAKTADLSVFGPHSLRHYFATELMRKGIHINHISQILGHSSIKTTERIYIHFLPSYLSGVTNILDEKMEKKD